MTNWTRRSFIAATGLGLVGCTSRPRVLENPRDQLDRRVDDALSELYRTVPGAAEVARNATGMLVVPKIRKAGFFASGAYGEGALMIGQAKVDYYSLSSAGIGFTFGAAEFNQVLLFFTPEVLQDFRTADGWELGVNAAVAVPNNGGAAAGLTTSQINRPIQEIVFGQRGLIADASFDGAKYSRIVR